MKTSKRFLALVLSALMIFSVVIIPGADLSLFGFEADAADINIDGITQQRVVADYATKYAGYQSKFFSGSDTNWPTNFVIPGLSSANDYTPQGMTYWQEKEWILISAYDASGAGKHSVIYAIDAVSTEFVALFKILNADGSVNTSHGGGIAASDYNFYYADSGSKISYIPLSEMELQDGQNSKTIRLRESIDCSGELSGAATSYCCYDDGVLWAGNFYFSGDDRYKTPAHSEYNSLLLGYKLDGKNSEEEWNNLKRTSTDPNDRGHVGNPSYVIALGQKPGTENRIQLDRVQYAMVDKGKIYISRSWSRTESTNHIRELDIGDMDIYSPGAVDLTINGITRKCHYVDPANTDSFRKFGGTPSDNNTKNQMFYMGEALCVIEDYLYMFGEGAAWTYNGKESNKCTEPIDVIWKIDQHAINNVARPAEEVKAMYYEKINSNSDIVDGEEYIIVFESQEKDPVTQKNILYAVDSFGGYDGAKLPKKQYESEAYAEYTNHSMGIIGYPITSYSTDMLDNGTEILHIDENDDNRKSIRWTITHNGTGGYSFLNSDYYYGKNRYLCFAHEVFTMNFGAEYCGILGSNGNLNITDWGHTLWCNAGYTQEQLDKYTEFYKNHGQTAYLPVYNGLEEVKGTFHIEPKDPSADKAVPDDYKIMHIYKRVKDPYASTLETDVFTDLNAELQPDGTYTITLETYATAAIQYMESKKEKPTDFFFVLDNSDYMNEKDSKGFYTGLYDGSKNEWKTLALDKIIPSDGFEQKQNDYQKTYVSSEFFYKHSDNRYYPINITVKQVGDGCDAKFLYWTYYIADDGNVYRLHTDGDHAKITWTTAQLEDAIKYNQDQSATEAIKGGKVEKPGSAYAGPHYSFCYNQDIPQRIHAAQDFISEMTFQIAADNKDHRVALITFDNDAVSYLNNGNGAIGNKTQDSPLNEYQKVYFTNNEFSTFRNLVYSIGTTGEKDSQPSVATGRITNTLNYCAQDYTYTGERNAVVFILTGTDDFDKDTAIINQAIQSSSKAKRAGAFIYTVKLGNKENTQTNNFLQYASSNYINATSVSSPGERNNKKDNYNLEIPVAFNTVAEFKDTVGMFIKRAAHDNGKDTFVKINETSIIQENIGQFFNTNALTINDFECATVDASYDGLGRLYFPENTKKVIADKLATDSNNDGTIDFKDGKMYATDMYTLNVKGFNFSEHYVSSANISTGNAKKLVVTIKGLTLNSTVNNEAVTNDKNTGIYLNNGEKRKGYPTDHINVPEYTYVLDYGIGMLDTDVNGTLQSISVLPNKQTSYNEALPNAENNNVTIAMSEDQQNLIYGLLPDASKSNNAGYCLIQRPDYTYDWFKINVVPASNVYFEETAITLPAGSDWTASTTSNEISQDLTNENDVYGYDKGYLKDGNGFSNGTVYTSFVNDSKLRSDTLKFDYTGTAIDLYGSCGPDTGIYIVTIKNGDSIEKVYITDTYFSDTDILGDNDRLNQVPFVHHENKDQYGGPMYGKHTVEITSVYLNSMVGQRGAATFGLRDNVDTAFDAAAFEEDVIEAILMYAEMEELMDENIEISFCDENSVLNGGEGADVATTFGFFTTGANTSASLTNLTNYFDGFRTYQPAGLGAADGMYPDSEQGARYYNVMKNLVSGSAITSGATNLNGIAYLEKDASAEDTITFADYDKKGPKNELYLNPGNAISFNLKFDGETITPNSKAMISLRTVNGEAKVVINGKEYTINNTMEMYYRIDEIPADGLVYIQNTSAVDTNGNGSLVVIDTLKITNGVMAPMMMSAMPRIRMMMSAPPTPSEPNAPETEEIPDIPAPEAPPVVEPLPEEPSNEPEDGEDNNEEKGFFELLTESFTKLLNMIQSMLDKIVNLLKSIIA